MPYEQLSEYDRYVICHMHRYGFSNGEIGRRLKGIFVHVAFAQNIY